MVLRRILFCFGSYNCAIVTENLVCVFCCAATTIISLAFVRVRSYIFLMCACMISLNACTIHFVVSFRFQFRNFSFYFKRKKEEIGTNETEMMMYFKQMKQGPKFTYTLILSSAYACI